MAKLADATGSDDFAAALGAAETVVADFYTPSCVLCRKIEPMLAAVEQGYAGRMRAFKVDAEGNPEIAGRYAVRGVPTVILFQGGEAKDRRSGFMTAQKLREWIGPYLDAGSAGR